MNPLEHGFRAALAAHGEHLTFRDQPVRALVRRDVEPEKPGDHAVSEGERARVEIECLRSAILGDPPQAQEWWDTAEDEHFRVVRVVRRKLTWFLEAVVST